MNIPGLTKAYIAEAIIAPYRIVKHGTADDKIIQSSAVGDAHLGITTSLPAAIGEHVDVIKSDTANVEYGATVTRGAPLTSDAVGRAVVATPAAAANNRIIGFAEVAGVVGDIGQVWVMPSVMQG